MHFHAAHENSHGVIESIGGSPLPTLQDAVDRIRSYSHSWKRTGDLYFGGHRTLHTVLNGRDLVVIDGRVRAAGRHTWRAWGCISKTCTRKTS